jgi:hypothetical protein
MNQERQRCARIALSYAKEFEIGAGVRGKDKLLDMRLDAARGAADIIAEAILESSTSVALDSDDLATRIWNYCESVNWGQGKEVLAICFHPHALTA